MSLGYVPRLLCLSAASFFLAHLLLGLAVMAIAPAAARFGERMRPRRAAALLLGLRLLPPAVALFAVAGVCVPSFLWLEPAGTAEAIGPACLAAAAFGVWISLGGLARGLRAIMKSRRCIPTCDRQAGGPDSAGNPPVFVMETAAPILALAGVFQPRLLVSRGMLEALPAEELDAVFRHEGGHRTSRDNLKRLAMLFAPGIAPFRGGFLSLERAWGRMAEWAADDWAVAGDVRRSVSLAAALVRVARMAPPVPPSPLATSLLGSGADLPARIDRLLGDVAAGESAASNPALAIGAPLIFALAVAVITGPGLLRLAHRFLEMLVR